VTRPARRDERGVTLIIFTLMITVMLVFVALAMDSGLVFNERRQDQSAADSAVLEAAQILLDFGVSPATEAAAEDAIIKGTLTNTKSTNGAPLLGPGGWTERWAHCTATIPPGFTKGTSSACIAFHVSTGSGDTTKVWAHLPPITVGSTFGGVVGINEHKQTAEATAEIFVGDPYAVFAAATDCDGMGNVEQAVDIGDTGKQVGITGSVHSNGSVELSSNTTLSPGGSVTYVKDATLPPQIIPFARLTGVETDPLADYRIEDYGPSGTKALAAGSLYINAGNATVDNGWLQQNGALDAPDHVRQNLMIYSTGPIELSGPLSGQATFVSTDHIVFSGDGFQLRARNNDVLAFSSAGDTGCGGEAAIRFNGGDNTWNGVVYAPAGTIRSCSTAQPCSPNDPPGRKTTFNGGLIGWIVDLDSPNFAITNIGGLGTPVKVRLYE